MRNQIIEINEQSPTLFASTRRDDIPTPLTVVGAYWMHVFPPLSSDHRVRVVSARQLCPWGMAGEMADPATSDERRKDILESLRNAQKTIRLFSLPACRMMFSEDNLTKKISDWVD